MEGTGRVIGHTRSGLSGATPPGATPPTRWMSLYDSTPAPSSKGRLGTPVEFGYKAQIADNADGLVVDYDLHAGNPPDAPLLAPAIDRIARRVGKVLRAVTADRGYGEAGVAYDLTELGVATIAIPRKAKPTAARREIEQPRSFRRLLKWRTGPAATETPPPRSRRACAETACTRSSHGSDLPVFSPIRGSSGRRGYNYFP